MITCCHCGKYAESVGVLKAQLSDAFFNWGGHDGYADGERSLEELARNFLSENRDYALLTVYLGWDPGALVKDFRKRL